jgi:Asp-tRNA(Asn)/Glu-tRNA(Gln) amidotransferase A subunit family amidase
MSLAALDLSGADLARAYAEHALSPREVAEQALERIERAEPQLHAFVTVTPELLLQQADAAAVRLRDGETGALLGVPVSIKDLFDVENVPTTFGSLVFRDNVAARDSGAVRRLRSAGALFTGKTNTAEFAQSATCENRLGPDTVNPWDHRLTPGGSSGGAAVSVAGGMSTVALGTDGGGSLRIPAEFTGLVGMKPSRGLCRDEGGFVTMADFSSPGPLAHSVDDVRRVLTVLADTPFSRTRERPPLRVGWCARPEGRPVAAPIADAVARGVRMLQEIGHRVEEVELPFDGWQELFRPFVLETENRCRGQLLTSHAAELTTYMEATLRAARRRAERDSSLPWDALRAYRSRMARFFDSVDIAVSPTTAVQPFPIGTRPSTVEGEPIDGLWGPFPFTAPFNVAGVPALSLPCALVGGLPVGIQLAAAAGHDALLLDVAEELEEALNVELRPPRMV